MKAKFGCAPPLEEKANAPKWRLALLDYFRNSGMHGLQYVADPTLHLTEKFFWLSSFLISLLFAVYLINEVWVRYEETPVIVSLQSMDTEIYEIPFPAVTICNINTIPKNYVETVSRLAKISGKEDDDARDQLRYVQSLCEGTGTFAKTHGFAESRGEVKSHGQNFTSRDPSISTKIFDVLENSTPSCEEMIRVCVWSRLKRNCSHLFKSVITSIGKCCSFNRIPNQFLYSDALIASWAAYADITDDENVEPEPFSGQNSSWGKWNYSNSFLIKDGTTRPYFQNLPGTAYGLSILLEGNSQDYFCPAYDSKGFSVFLGTPVEEPRMKQFGKVIGLGREVFVEVAPEVTVADPDIKRFHQNKRQCVFPEERKLKFYRSYTQKNCIQECKSLEITKRCSCVPYHMTRFLNTSICASDPESLQYKCYNGAIKVLDAQYRQICSHCPNLCPKLDYSAKFRDAKLQNHSKLWFNQLGGKAAPDWETSEVALVHIYFKLHAFEARIRRELFGKADLIANMGNILTLCLGFSALSGVEIIYFLTLRIFWKYFHSKRNMVDTGSNQVQHPSNSVSSVRKVLCKLMKYNTPPSETDLFVQRELQAYTV